MDLVRDFDRLVAEGQVKCYIQSNGETIYTLTDQLKFIYTSIRIEVVDGASRLCYNYNPDTKEYTVQRQGWTFNWLPPKPVHWLRVKQFIISLIYKRLELSE